MNIQNQFLVNSIRHLTQLVQSASRRMTGWKSLKNYFGKAKYLMFYTYVLYSKAFDKIYIGFTSDLERRIASHNDSRNSGWTKNFQPWEMVYHEAFETKAEAMKREKQLKTAKGRSFIRQSIILGI